MCKFINHWTDIVRALATIVAMTFVGVLGVHAYEYFMPTSHYFEYRQVVPAKEIFAKDDPLEFISSVIRHRAIDTQWQDRLYCDNGYHIEKYPTQVIPSNGTEYMQSGEFTSLWKYVYKIEADEKQCRMCGNVIGVTQYGYKKVHSYCTDWFDVNF